MPSLDQCLTTYLKLDRSPRTNAQYAMVLSRLVQAIGPARDVRLISYEDLVDYLARLRATIKPSTCAGYVSIIKSFFNWCHHRGYIDRSPAAAIVRKIPPPDPSRSRAIPTDELRRIVDYARITSPRNYALLLFMIDTGCRVGGLVSLMLGNLDLERMSAKLLEKGRVWQTVYFGTTTADALRAWLEKRPAVKHDYVWTGQGRGNPITTNAVFVLLHRLSERTECSRLWSPHAIRHAVGHAYAKAGVPVTVTQHKLNHASPAITMGHYYPHDDAYMIEVSHRYELLALRSDEDSPVERLQLRVVSGSRKTGS